MDATVNNNIVKLVVNKLATKPDTFSVILDGNNGYVSVDLLKYLPDSHVLKRMALKTAALTSLPPSSVFLTQLGVFSAFAARRWAVKYQNGCSLPIGIYACCEQPSGTGKSWCLSIAETPFRNIKKAVIANHKTALAKFDGIEKLDESQQLALDELKAKTPAINSKLSISNSTPEALEATLLGTKGFFAAISSEQGLLDSMLGLSYGKGGPSNKDVLLHGFDGGFMSSCRVGRDGYYGTVIGGVALFAQQGSVEKLLDSSCGTGLAERFLFLCEPHSLGFRNFSLPPPPPDPSIAEDYQAACDFAKMVFECPVDDEGLLGLSLSDESHAEIGKYRNLIEPHLKDGGKFSHGAIRSAASKINIQIMKIAANLHLCDGDQSNSKIHDWCVISAINICNKILEATLALCKVKGIIGASAEFGAVLSMFETDIKPKTERQIIQSRSRVEPFRSFTGNKSTKIRETLTEMVEQGLLFAVDIVNGATLYRIKQ